MGGLPHSKGGTKPRSTSFVDEDVEFDFATMSHRDLATIIRPLFRYRGFGDIKRFFNLLSVHRFQFNSLHVEVSSVHKICRRSIVDNTLLSTPTTHPPTPGPTRHSTLVLSFIIYFSSALKSKILIQVLKPIPMRVYLDSFLLLYLWIIRKLLKYNSFLGVQYECF